MSALSGLSTLMDAWTCSVCLDIPLVPFRPPCGHNLCLHCAQALPRSVIPDVICIDVEPFPQALCPECRRPFDVPDSPRAAQLTELFKFWETDAQKALPNEWAFFAECRTLFQTSSVESSFSIFCRAYAFRSKIPDKIQLDRALSVFDALRLKDRLACEAKTQENALADSWALSPLSVAWTSVHEWLTQVLECIKTTAVLNAGTRTGVARLAALALQIAVSSEHIDDAAFRDCAIQIQVQCMSKLSWVFEGKSTSPEVQKQVHALFVIVIAFQERSGYMFTWTSMFFNACRSRWFGLDNILHRCQALRATRSHQDVTQMIQCLVRMIRTKRSTSVPATSVEEFQAIGNALCTEFVKSRVSASCVASIASKWTERFGRFVPLQAKIQELVRDAAPPPPPLLSSDASSSTLISKPGSHAVSRAVSRAVASAKHKFEDDNVGEKVKGGGRGGGKEDKGKVGGKRPRS